MDSLLGGDLGNIVIPAVMDGISNSRGEDFFQAITEGNTKARTICVCKTHEIIPNFDYDLQYTPCERVTLESAQLHSGNVQQNFPRDQMLLDLGINGYYGPE